MLCRGVEPLVLTTVHRAAGWWVVSSSARAGEMDFIVEIPQGVSESSIVAKSSVD